MPTVEKTKTCIAGEALEAYRRVKIDTTKNTAPPTVIYADAGEDFIGITEYAVESGDDIAVILFTAPGSHHAEIALDTDVLPGTILYGAADGKFSDASSGSAQAVALADAVDGEVIEVMIFAKKSTTAGAVSVADSANMLTAATVEAALSEIMQAVKTSQYFIPPSNITLEDGTAVGKFSSAAAATFGFFQESDKDLVLRWNNHATPGKAAARFLLPLDLDDSADIVVNFVGAIAKAGADEADSPTLTTEAFFSTVGADPGADADCGGVSGEFLTSADAAWQKKQLIIAAADVPAAPAVLTLVFNPTDGELPADDFLLSQVYLEVTRKALTS